MALYPQSRKRQSLEQWLEELLATFEGRILPVDRKIAQEWGHYYAAQQQAGRKPPSLDSFVAATAKVHQLTIVSRNEADFPDIPVVNPWEVSKDRAVKGALVLRRRTAPTGTSCRTRRIQIMILRRSTMLMGSL